MSVGRALGSPLRVPVGRCPITTVGQLQSRLQPSASSASSQICPMTYQALVPQSSLVAQLAVGP